MSDSNGLRFLGLTKTQFVYVAVVLVVALACINAFLLVRYSQLAADGAQAHAVQCVLKADYRHRLDDNEAFLGMTVKERVAKYGDALGHTPPSLIRQSERALKANLVAMQGLRCE